MKSQIQHLRQDNFACKDRLGNKRLERALEVLGDGKVSTSWQCVLAARNRLWNRLPGKRSHPKPVRVQETFGQLLWHMVSFLMLACAGPGVGLHSCGSLTTQGILWFCPVTRVLGDVLSARQCLSGGHLLPSAEHLHLTPLGHVLIPWGLSLACFLSFHFFT